MASHALVQRHTLAEGLAEKKEKYAELLRLGRTGLQDAQPMALGQAFGGYEAVLRRHAHPLNRLRQDFLVQHPLIILNKYSPDVILVTWDADGQHDR